MKIITNIILCLLLCASAYGAQTTTNYELVIPAIGARDYQPILSRDIISIDSIMGILSSDIGGSAKITIISTEVSEIREDSAINTGTLSVDAISVDSVLRLGMTSSSATGSGAVGRIPIVSADGTVCYIKLYN